MDPFIMKITCDAHPEYTILRDEALALAVRNLEYPTLPVGKNKGVACRISAKFGNETLAS